MSQQRAFREAGKPADNRCAIRAGYYGNWDIRGVKVDGESIAYLPPGCGIAAWRMEMLPGPHKIEAQCGACRWVGDFIAERGEEYVLVLDTTFEALKKSGNEVGQTNLSFERQMKIWVAKIPPGEDRAFTFSQRLTGDTGSSAHEKQYERVAYLKPQATSLP